MTYPRLMASRAFLRATPILLALLLVAALIAILTGSADAGIGALLGALFSESPSQDGVVAMLLDLRLPRIVLAVLGGALLAISGYLLQVVSRNGLADPGILGLADGAVVAVLVTVAFWPGLTPGMSGFAALFGALAVAGLIVGLGRRLLSGGGVILVGLALNIVLGSIVEIILASGGASQFSQYLTWSRGTLNAVDAADAWLVACWFAIVVPLAFLFSRHLGPLLLGSDDAQALGVSVRVINAVFVLLAAAAAAPVVATCGPIAFVGLMAAHAARRLVGERPTEILLISMLVGALVLLVADTIGRSLFTPIIVSAGILVSVTGVISFVLIAGLSALRRQI